MEEINEFNKEKQSRIENLNKRHPEGFRNQWAIFFKGANTYYGVYKTILDKNGKCFDLVKCSDSEWGIPSCTVSGDKKSITCDITGYVYDVVDNGGE